MKGRCKLYCFCLGIGGKVYVNLNGDRDADFSLLDLDPVTGKYRVSDQMSNVMRKFSVGYSTSWQDSIQPVQLQRFDRILNFCT